MEKRTRVLCYIALLLLINDLICAAENVPVSSSPTVIPTLHQIIKNQMLDRGQLQDRMLYCLEQTPDVASMLASQFHDESRAMVQSMYPVTLSDAACLHTLQMPTTNACSAILATDECIVVGDDEGVLSVWDAHNWQLKAQLLGHTNRIRQLLIDKYGRIISASNDHTLRIWNTNDFSCTGVLTGHTDWIDCAAISPNNELISGSHDQTARVWDLQTLTLKKALEGHTNWVTGVAFDTDGDIVSVSDDSTVRTWDAITYASKRVIELPNGGCIRSVLCMSEDDLMIGLITGELYILAAKNGEIKKTIKFSDDQITHLQLLAHGDLLVSSDRIATRIIDREMLMCKGVITPSVCATVDNKKVITADDNGQVYCWDVSMLSMHDDAQLLKAALLYKKQANSLTDEQKLAILQQCIHPTNTDIIRKHT